MIQRKKISEVFFIGFAILMYGMDMMSSAVKPLAEVPEFTNLLLKFSNPLLGVIAGALLTAVIQSSSASVGILQALCLTGAVPFGVQQSRSLWDRILEPVLQQCFLQSVLLRMQNVQQQYICIST